MKSSEDFWIGVGTAVVAPVLMVGTVLLRAKVVEDLWRWYVEGQFGVPGIRLVDAFGLALLIGFLTKQTQVEKKQPWYATLIEALSFPALTWGVGWVGSWWL